MVYNATNSFPKHELYGLVSQVRRRAASVPANIAERSARNGQPELRHLLGIALGSATELEYHLILARDLGYLPAERRQQLDADVAEVKRMLVSFIRRLTPVIRTDERSAAARPTNS